MKPKKFSRYSPRINIKLEEDKTRVLRIYREHPVLTIRYNTEEFFLRLASHHTWDSLMEFIIEYECKWLLNHRLVPDYKFTNPYYL